MADVTTADDAHARSQPSPAREAAAPPRSAIAQRARMLKLRYGLFALGAIVLVLGQATTG